MQLFCESLGKYKRLTTKEVTIGTLKIGNGHPIAIQTMTTADTMDTEATIAESIRCIKAGAQLVRITAPSKKEAHNLQAIKDGLRAAGYNTPLVADIHFTPNAAEIAAKIVEKVRVNPGNYADKKKFETHEYTDASYHEELNRISEKFIPLVRICKEYGTAMRIGTNHGSLSDRIMSRFGDTAIGMVESALEFLRIARSQDYHNIVLSMKSSNPQVMVQAYRLLVQKMDEEFGECYPLHLGVTEAGDGEDGRIKSAVGIGALLKDGLGDTIRVSLTEDPEFELPVCVDLIHECVPSEKDAKDDFDQEIYTRYNPFEYKRRATHAVQNIGGEQVPIVVGDFGKLKNTTAEDLKAIGYTYDAALDKWKVSDFAADYLFIEKVPAFKLPGTLRIITWHDEWKAYQTFVTSSGAEKQDKVFPYLTRSQYLTEENSTILNFVDLGAHETLDADFVKKVKEDATVVLVMYSTEQLSMKQMRAQLLALVEHKIEAPVVFIINSKQTTPDQHLIHYATEAGALLLDGFGDGLILGVDYGQEKTLTDCADANLNAFGILQATRTRISKTEYISCPSCGRTLFDLQETTAKIRARTNHLKGVKIAIMGCIVNGPGEMADADFGYVGSGVGKITLYKGQEVVKRSIPSEVAVDELINLLKANEAWVEPSLS
jgi:(E)-4-hydroxy-3-methylbut-2-enyl-diphosphate synthase